MLVAPDFIPLWLNFAACLTLLVAVVVAAWTAPWRALQAATVRLHVLFGSLLALLLLWQLSLNLIDGVWIHLLGVTSLTLLVGWRFAVLGATLVLFAHVWMQQQSLLAVPLSWVFTVLVPATTTRVLAYVLRTYGLSNLFVYMLGAGFGGGLASVLVVAALAIPLFWLMGQIEWVALALENWSFVLLIMFPEGFVNGMVVTALTVFYPELMKTFDEDFYLQQ